MTLVISIALGGTMIILHKLNHDRDSMYLNPDLIQVVESKPDTHVILTTGSHLVVCETPDEVARAVLAYRVRLLTEALSPTKVVQSNGGVA